MDYVGSAFLFLEKVHGFDASGYTKGFTNLLRFLDT
jgi:hypothetical protein